MAVIPAVRQADRKIRKAATIVVEGRAEEAPGRIFVVDGDSGRYLVTLLDGDYRPGTGRGVAYFSCTCTWGRSANDGRCSHVMAAAAIVESEKPKADVIRAFRNG